MDPLVRALRKEQRTRIHAYTVQDISTAIRISQRIWAAIR